MRFRRLDTVKRYIARNARLLGALNDEIAKPGRCSFRSNACIGWNQCAVGEARPVTPDGGVRSAPLIWINRVVDMVDPLNVGAEASLIRHVKRQMDAEPPRLRHGVNKVTERAAGPGEREVISLGEVFGRGRCWGPARSGWMKRPMRQDPRR